MIYSKKLVLLGLILGALSGCEMMNSNYDCPLSEGASCMSLHDMDEAVSRGIYPKEFKHAYNDNPYESYVLKTDAIPEGHPLRTKDKIAKIWVAPYMDKDGNYHEQSNIYTVVENSSWDLNQTHLSNAQGASV